MGAKPHPDYDLKDWVLSKFTGEDAVKMRDAAYRAADAACLIAQDRMDEAMNRFSRITYSQAPSLCRGGALPEVFIFGSGHLVHGFSGPVPSSFMV